jgi:hypothetical protein
MAVQPPYGLCGLTRMLIDHWPLKGLRAPAKALP